MYFFLEMIDKLLFSFTIMIIKIQDTSKKRYFKAINCFKKSYFVNQSSIFFVTILNSTCIGLNSTFSQCNDDLVFRHANDRKRRHCTTCNICSCIIDYKTDPFTRLYMMNYRFKD